MCSKNDDCCNIFIWFEDKSNTNGKIGTSVAGPLCKCYLPSIRRDTRKPGQNQGRCFWSCAATGDRTCNFFAFVAEGRPGYEPAEAVKESWVTPQKKLWKVENERDPRCPKCGYQISKQITCL